MQKKILNKIQFSFIIKTSNKMGIKGIHLKIIKAIHDRPTANIFNDEELETVPLRSGTRIPTLWLLFNIMLEVLAKAFSHGKKTNKQYMASKFGRNK